MLRIEGASAGYGRILVIDGLSLDLMQGGVLAVIGPNGAGKSTLMRLICGAIPIRGGAIRFAGDDVSTLAAEQRSERGIVLCPEGRRIFSSLTVEENLVLGATPLRRGLGASGFRQAVAEGIARAYSMFPMLGERRWNSGGALSGGQQQMLAVARALMARPRLLLLDEPSLGLSPKIADEVYATLAKLKGEGLTTIIVEESAGRPLVLADQAIVMRGGCIVRQGAASVIAAASDLAAAYLGAA